MTVWSIVTIRWTCSTVYTVSYSLLHRESLGVGTDGSYASLEQRSDWLFRTAVSSVARKGEACMAVTTVGRSGRGQECASGPGNVAKRASARPGDFFLPNCRRAWLPWIRKRFRLRPEMV